MLPKNIQTNIKFLEGFILKRGNADQWIPDLITRLGELGKASIIELACEFSRRTDPLHILPIIYHLIATGVFSFNLHERITEHSEITCAPVLSQLSTLFNEEVVEQ